MPVLKNLLSLVARPGCHSGGTEATASEGGTVALVGTPNVGKSALFNRLTGTYVTVSNYPGTTVEVSRGTATIAGRRYGIVDMPGMYSLLPLSEDERVARRILLEEGPEAVVHMADATNLERMLPLTRQLLEAGLPVILVLNMMDEAEAAGLTIDAEGLREELGVPVIKAVATSGRGLAELRRAVADAPDPVSADRFRPSTSAGRRVADGARRIAESLQDSYAVSRRALALLLLQGDEEARELASQNEPGALESIDRTAEQVRGALSRPVDYVLAVERRRWASGLLSRCVGRGEPSRSGIGRKLSDLMTHPLTGLPALALVLYFGLYRLVGVFGAGTVVDSLEGTVFEELVNPLRYDGHHGHPDALDRPGAAYRHHSALGCGALLGPAWGDHGTAQRRRRRAADLGGRGVMHLPFDGSAGRAAPAAPAGAVLRGGAAAALAEDLQHPQQDVRAGEMVLLRRYCRCSFLPVC